MQHCKILSNDKIKEETIECFKEFNKKNRDKAIILNLNLARNIAKLYVNNDMVELNIEDLESIAYIGLIKAVDTFDISKGFAFSTYAVRCIKNQILMYLRKHKNCISINTEVVDTLTLEDMIGDKKSLDGMQAIDYLSLLNGILNEKEKRMIILSYNDVIQADIAKKEKVEQSVISRRLKKIKNKIKENL